MVNILYILFQVSCIILLMLLSKNPVVMTGNNSFIDISDLSDFSPKKVKAFKISKTKNPLSLEVMEELKNKILIRKTSEFKDLEEKVKFNNWLSRNNFDNIVSIKKGVILDLNSVNFNNIKSSEKFMKNIKFIEKRCFEKSLILFIIGERRTYEFIKELKYFNKLNYISPYNYSKSYFWSTPSKLSIGKYKLVPCNVSINDMISDISNQYGILLNDLVILNFNNIYEGVNYNITHNVIQ